MMMKMMSWLAVGMTMFLLTNCGGGGGSSDDSPSTRTGYFIDAPVQGLTYSTATQNGTTGANGSFTYMPGETLTFSIGDITLGSAPGASTITPVTLVSNGTTSNAKVINICRLLQSLDSDTNPNTITIPTQVLTNASSPTAQQFINQLDFANATTFDSAAANLLSVLTSGVSEYSSAPTLIDKTTAQQHLETSLGVNNGSQCDSSHLTLCVSSGTCTSAGGYWWSDNTCSSVCESGSSGCQSNETVMWKGREWQQKDDGNTYTFNGANTYCADLVLDGKSDWYLPTKDELKSLVVCSNGTPTPLDDYTISQTGTYSCGSGYKSPTIDASFSSFSYIYWSSSAHTPGDAWYVNFQDGLARWPTINGRSYYVRCVR